MEEQQLCTRLLPQICLLLVDKSPEVRDLALVVMQASCDIMKTSHAEKRKGGSVGAASPASHAGDKASGWLDSPSKEKLPAAITPSPGSGSGAASSTVGWASWAVGGIAQAVERATLEATTTDHVPVPGHAGGVLSSSSSAAGGGRAVSTSQAGHTPGDKNSKPIVPSTAVSASAGGADGWSDDDDIQFEDDEMDTANSAYTSAGTVGIEEGGGVMGGLVTPQSGGGSSVMKLSTSNTSLASTGSDDGLGVGVTAGSSTLIAVPGGLTPSSTTTSKRAGGMTASAKKKDGNAGGLSTGSATKKGVPKPVVKKLAVTGDEDNWDDF